MDFNVLYELTRQGKNPCRKCGKPLEMYYKPWCPHCEKPTLDSVPTLNLLQALRHLEAVGHDGIKDRFWRELIEYAPIKNDTYFTMVFPADADDAWSEEHYNDLMTLKRVFELGDSIVMEVSW